MNAIPNCRLELTDPPSAWREWARTITYGQLVECRGKLMRESINVVSPTIAKAIGGIVGVIDAEYLRRFPDAVAECVILRARLKSDAASYKEKLKLANLISEGRLAEIESLTAQLSGNFHGPE